MNKVWGILLFILILCNKAFAQLTATTTPVATANNIVQKFAGDGILISNAVLTCPNGASGIFNASATSLGIDSGIVLTTGSILTYVTGTLTNYGINAAASSFAKVDNLITGGDADLATSAGQPQSSLHDLCKLDFDFVPLGDTIQFRYKFGSEEYPNYNCTQFSDIFGFYITSGPGYTSATNIALIPGTNIPVSVNSINDGTTLFGNPATCSGLGAGSPFTSLYQNNSSSGTIVYNGLTQLLQATAVVTACSTYHMKIAIADLGDGDRDSGVFLEAGSLKAKVATIDSVKSTNSVTLNTPFVIEGCKPDTIYISRPFALGTAATYSITTGGTATNGIDYTVANTITIPAGSKVGSVILTANFDAINEGTESIKLYLYGSTCPGTITDSVTISLLEYPLYNVSDNDTICIGQNVTLNANNISSNPYLTFTWNPGAVNNNSITVNPTSNTSYTVSAKYPGCNNRDTIVNITVSPLPTVNAGADVSICNNSSTNLSALAGNFAPFGIAYNWSPSLGLSSSIINNPLANPTLTTNYTLTVTNGAGCSATDAIQITVAPPLLINTSITNVNCNGASSGAINASVTGAFGTTTYSISPGGTSNTTGIFNTLAAGTYTITASNSIGCTKTSVVTLLQAPAIIVGIPINTNPSCFGGNNGTINITATGGTGSYSYLLNPSGSTSSGTFSNVTAGIFTITATDANGCTKTTTTTLGQPSALVFSNVNTTNINCNGANNGVINTTLSGGTLTYSFNLQPSNTNNTSGNFTSLAPAVYTITGTDNKGCTTTTAVTITQPAGMVFNTPTLTNPTCIPGNNGSIAITASGGSGTKTYSINPGTASNTTGTFTNLGIGAFVITVTDANNCTKTTVANLLFINSPVISGATITNVACNGQSNGALAITTSSGNGTINYTLNPGSITNTSGTFSALAPGTYTVSVVDNSGCTSFSTYVITQPAVLNVNNITITNPACNTSTNGTIQLSMIGGNPAYTYTLNPGAITSSSGSFNNIAAGNYTISITDSKGCTRSTTATLVLPTPVIWSGNNAVINVLCNNAATGGISGTAAGGTGGKTYSISPGGNSNSTGNFNNLAAGTYTVIATDTKGCTTSKVVTVNQTNAITINTISTTAASCNPGADGGAIFNASNGTPTYTFTLNTNVTNTSGLFTNLNAGIFTVNVVDANGCTQSTTAIVANVSGPTIDSISYIEPNICRADSSDSVKVNATGAGMLTYTLLPNGWVNNTGFFNGLTNGAYNVIVQDASGCTAATSFIIQLPDSIALSYATSYQPLCAGSTTGGVTVQANGGTAPFTFTNLSTGATNTTGVYNGIPIGTIQIQVVDSNGCKDTIPFTVGAPTPLVINSVIKTNVICFGAATGNTNVNATGGSGLLTYTINPGGQSNGSGIFNSLIAGTYTVTITDGSACTITTSISISQPPPFNINSVNSAAPTCTNPTGGSYTIAASGGNSGITYSVNGVSNATGIFTGLSASTYTIIATDAQGCTLSSVSNLILPNGPNSIPLISHVSCNGGSNGSVLLNTSNGLSPYTYSFNNAAFVSTNNFTGLSGGTYTVIVKDANNCTASVLVNIINPLPLSFSSITATNISCFGLNNGSIVAVPTGGTGSVGYNLVGVSTNTTGIFNNLGVNTYTLIATDSKSCTVNTTVSISQPSAIVIASPTLTMPTCIPNNNGVINISATGGVGALNYALAGVGNNTNGLFNNLIAITYTLTITDANGCTNTSIITLNSPNAPIINSFVKSNVSCFGGNNGFITVNASSTAGGIQYNLNPTNITNNTGSFNALGASIYTVTITDANGCTVSSSANIIQPPSFSVFSTSALLPSCNISNNGNIVLSTLNSTGTVNYLLNPTASTNTTGTFSNLSGNIYTITATNANTCTATTVINLLAPPALSWNNFTGGNINCFGNNTGQLIANAIGGTGTINYTLNPSSATNSNGGFYNLFANTYTLVATDANGCSIQSSIQIIQPATGITINTIASTIPTCIPGNDANINANATGGVGTLSYSIDGNTFNTTGLFGSIGAGVYTITVKDANNCTKTSSITVANPNSPMATINNIIPPTCNGLANGSLNVSATNGAGPINFLLNPGSISSFTGSFTNIMAQTYTLTLVDSIGCSSNTPITIGQPSGIQYAITVINSALCFGGVGSISYSGTGGTGSITTTLLPTGSTSTSGIFTNVSAGTYTLQGVDANGCTGSTVTSITSPPALYWSAFNSINVSCNGGTNGFIAGNVRGGSGAITYNLMPGNIIDTTGIFLNLSSAIYTIVATDANGCTITTVCNIAQPLPLAFSTLSATIPTCIPGNDAILTAIANGGTPNYQFSLNNGVFGTASVFNNLGISTYTVTIKDSKNCTYSQTINVINPGAPQFNTPALTMPLCFGNSNGIVNATASGGTGILTYTLLPNNTSNTTGLFNSLSANSYTVNVIDASQCSASTVVVLTQPNVLVFNTGNGNNPICFGTATGSISYTNTGGTGALSYTINPGVITTINTTATNLVANIYTVIATDTKGCTTVTNITLNNPPQLLFNNFVSTSILCNGGNNGAISTSSIGGTGIITYSLSPNNINNTFGLFNGLIAGNYAVTITDANGCSTSSSTALSQPPALTISINNTIAATCLPGADGTISVNSNGGFGTKIYSISGNSTTNTTGVFNGLSNISYTLTVTDANGCTATTSTTLIVPNSPIITAAFINPASCNPNNNGSISITASLGTTPYTYSINNGLFSSSNAFNSLIAGSYTTVVKDANGCTGSSIINIFTTPAVVINSANSTNVSCFGLGNGTLSSTASVGSLPYNYNLLPSSLSNTNGSFNNLQNGNYTLQVVDANGCISTTLVTITQPNLLQITSLDTTWPLCFNGTNGSITTNYTGGTGGFTFTLNGSITNTNGVFNFLSGNASYTINIVDANNCTTSATTYISQPTEVIIVSSTKQDVTCNNAANGSITINAIGGTGTINYNLNGGSASNTTGIFNNLSGGTYTIQCTDANGCSKTSTLFIYEPPAIIFTATTLTPVTCFGDMNGSVSTSATGGVGTLTYTIAPLSLSNTSGFFNNLFGANFTITVTDTNGCINDTVYTIAEPAQLLITNLSITQILCSGATNGSIATTTSGGNGGNSFTINPSSITNTTGIFNTIGAGTYSISVTDVKGCSSSSVGIISQPQVITVSIDSIKNLNCNSSNDGYIYTSAIGGVPNYLFTILPQNGSNQTGDFFNLGAGIYTILVTDANGCIDSLPNINIAQPIPVLIDSIKKQNVICYSNITGSLQVYASGGANPPYTYNLNPLGQSNTSGLFDSLASATYTIVVADADGCTATSSIFVEQNSELLLLNQQVTSPTCYGQSNGKFIFSPSGGVGPWSFSINGGPYLTDTVYNNIPAGNYVVIIKDFLNCTNDTTILVVQPDSLELYIVDIRNLYCDEVKNGGIDVQAFGGIEPYTYYVFPVNKINTTGIFNNLNKGTYTIEVADSNGCKTGLLASVDISLDSMQSSMVTTDVTCYSNGFDGTATVNVSNGTAPYTYFWSNPGRDTTTTADSLAAGKYYVQITDSLGCKISDTAYINATNCCTIFMPNAFSPNADNKNDVYFPIVGGSIENMYLQIFDRWGNMVFTTIDPATGWDGKYKNQPMDMDTYFYIIRYVCSVDKRNEVKSGDILLVR
jgi:large repetitive protein